MGHTSLRAIIDDDVIGRLDPPVLCLPSHNEQGISTFGPRKEVFPYEGSNQTNRSKPTKHSSRKSPNKASQATRLTSVTAACHLSLLRTRWQRGPRRDTRWPRHLVRVHSS